MTPLIACRQIEKQYGSGEAAVRALRGVDLEIPAGANVAIMGPSGSGKSTLLQILGCLDVPTGGQYFLDGTDVTQLDDDALSELRGRYVGFVFQAFHLLPRMDLVENVALPLYYQNVGKAERIDRAREALEMVKLGHRVHHKSHELSGGEKQRAAIARAVVHHPKLLLADEPTGNLDSRVKGEILDHLGELNAKMGVTLVIVTHDDDVAHWAKTVVAVKDGRLVEGAHK